MAGNEESHEELLSQLELLKRKIERAARRDQRTGENIAGAAASEARDPNASDHIGGNMVPTSGGARAGYDNAFGAAQNPNASDHLGGNMVPTSGGARAGYDNAFGAAQNPNASDHLGRNMVPTSGGARAGYADAYGTQSRRSQIKSPLRGAAAAIMEGRGAQRQERPRKQHTSPLGRRPDFDTTAHTTGSPTGMYEYHLERAAKLSRRLNYRKPVLIKDRDYRAGATYFDQPIMRLHYPERKGIDVAGRDIGPVARLVHDVSAPTHPHLAKGRGRLKLMRPVRNPFLDMNKGPPRGRRFYNRDVRDPMLEGEIPNHRRSRKYVEPTRPNVEDREFRHKQSKRRIRGPDQHDRNPVMDFMRGPPPAIRNTRKRNERMEKKLARPKGLPMHIFG